MQCDSSGSLEAPGCFLANPLCVIFTCDSGDVPANVEIPVVVKLKGRGLRVFYHAGSNGNPGLRSRVLTFRFSDPVGRGYS